MSARICPARREGKGIEMRLDDEKMLIADIASRLLVTMSGWGDQERATQLAVSRAIDLLDEVEAQVEARREVGEVKP